MLLCHEWQICWQDIRWKFVFKRVSFSPFPWFSISQRGSTVFPLLVFFILVKKRQGRRDFLSLLVTWRRGRGDSGWRRWKVGRKWRKEAGRACWDWRRGGNSSEEVEVKKNKEKAEATNRIKKEKKMRIWQMRKESFQEFNVSCS